MLKNNDYISCCVIPSESRSAGRVEESLTLEFSMISVVHHLPTLSQQQIQKLLHLTDLFLSWNQKLNLSAIRDQDGILIKHVLDSLLLLPLHLIEPGQRVLDLGTGGGFPGLTLAIAYPETTFTLLDATLKKLKVVQDMTQKLKLSNVHVVHGRAEDLNKTAEFRARFDRVVSRAVAKFPMLLKYAIPFIKPNGFLIAYQGPEMINTWQSFQPQAKKLHSHIERVIETTLPIENAKRCFVIVKKLLA